MERFNKECVNDQVSIGGSGFLKTPIIVLIALSKSLNLKRLSLQINPLHSLTSQMTQDKSANLSMPQFTFCKIGGLDQSSNCQFCLACFGSEQEVPVLARYIKTKPPAYIFYHDLLLLEGTHGTKEFVLGDIKVDNSWSK